MAEEKNQLVNFILNSKKGKNSSIGQELLQAAQEIKKNEEDEDDETLELRDKFGRFREFEQKGDILLIPYDSFQRFNQETQRRIKELDSIVWNGVFLIYSHFKENLKSVLECSDNIFFNIEKKGKHYELKILREAYFDNSLNNSTIKKRYRMDSYVSYVDGVLNITNL